MRTGHNGGDADASRYFFNDRQPNPSSIAREEFRDGSRMGIRGGHTEQPQLVGRWFEGGAGNVGRKQRVKAGEDGLDVIPRRSATRSVSVCFGANSTAGGSGLMPAVISSTGRPKSGVLHTKKEGRGDQMR